MQLRGVGCLCGHPHRNAFSHDRNVSGSRVSRKSVEQANTRALTVIWLGPALIVVAIALLSPSHARPGSAAMESVISLAASMSLVRSSMPAAEFPFAFAVTMLASFVLPIIASVGVFRLDIPWARLISEEITSKAMLLGLVLFALAIPTFPVWFDAELMASGRTGPVFRCSLVNRSCLALMSGVFAGASSGACTFLCAVLIGAIRRTSP